jgi:calcium-dependent protein kinase
VAYCHARHIVHRDIKPENILLENNEENSPIKIIDFGTSQCYDPEKKMRSKQGTAYYVAPEVLKKNYNEKCDVWSCGIILYILLTGRPPFNGKTDKEIIDQVESGVINYDTHELRKVSKEARSLLKAMTDYYPSKRISSVNALNHIWFSKEIKQSSELKSTVNVMQNLQEFRSHTKMEQAVYMYITTHLISNKEKTELRVVFESMDTNHDGQLSKDELIEGYTKISNNRLEAEAIVEDILQTADPDGNGFIDYTEFLVATANKKNMLSDEKLKATFDMFDQVRFLHRIKVAS